MATEGLHWAWKLLYGQWSTSIGTDIRGTVGGRARPVAIISSPTYSRPAALVSVRDAAELPAFEDGSVSNVTSYFDNRTGVVTAEGTVWLNPSTSMSNVSILPGMQPTTRPLDPSTLLGLSGCPLGSDLDRLMLLAAADTHMPDCNDNSSPLPWRAWVAEHTLVSAASHLSTGTPATSLAAAQKAHAAPQAVISLKSNGTVLARTYNPHIAAYVLAIGRWRVCNSSLQVKVDSSLAPVHRGNTSSKAWTYVGSNTWPLTTSQPLQRVPAANNQTAPAALLLGGEPYFLVPGLLVSEDAPGGSTGCEVSGEVGAIHVKQGP
ncbi:hypothetical protein HaLaN_24977 [Haematococcus lacustris]|uniref:Uncharacterized protein n=1 Tax=Haematococcus lacustris TaxID=44745 RepID=A0A699ZWA2_HAELA|nr:hypothetical protein HaLaN_24977 [Haematococcus lacustris]